MTNLTKAQLDELKTQLEARHAALREEIQEHLSLTGVDATALIDELDKLDGDAASLAADAEFNVAMMSRDIVELRDIEAALDRMAQHRYGVCVDCDEPIRLARLRAFPTAKRCVACQSALERGQGTPGGTTL